MTTAALVRHVVAVIVSGPAQDARPAAPGAAAGPTRFKDVHRVVVDGHPATRPGEFADLLVEPLRAAGRPVARIAARDFLRPASLRLEFGRRDPDALFDGWVDAGALNREVLRSVVEQGRYLPTLRDPVTDRSTRAGYVAAAPGTVIVLSGSLLLGLGLDADLRVHLALSAAAETRGTALDDAWQLAAYDRYRREVVPEHVANIVARYDDLRHPALVRGARCSVGSPGARDRQLVGKVPESGVTMDVHK